MARTVARGNQPTGQPAGQNPFGPAFEELGRFVVQSIGERVKGHKRRGRAEETARIFGGDTPPRQVETPEQGTQGQQPFSIPATQGGQTVNRASGQQPTQNPLVAAGITPRGAPTSGPVGNRVIQQTLQQRGAMPERQRQPTNRPAPSASGAPEGSPGGQGASQIAARQFEGTPQLGQGATRQEQLTSAGQRPQIEAAAQEMSRQPGSMGELMRRMPYERRVEVIDRMMEQGVRLDQIMKLGVSERADPNTDLAKLRSDFQNNLINRDEFMAQRQRILQGDQGDRMSVDELEAQTIQQMNTGDLSPEEGQRRLELIRGRDDPEGSAVNVALQDGTQVRGRTRPDGQLEILDEQSGQFVPAPRDAQIISRSLQGSSEDVLPRSTEADLRGMEASTRSFIHTANDAIELIQNTPDVNTFTGRAAGLVNDLQAEANALGRSMGLDFNAETLDPSAHSETFDNLGIQSQRMRSMITSLAFQAAAASGQTGRSVSDRDVQRFIREVGAQASDPRAFEQVLKDVSNRVSRRFRITHEVMNREPFQGDLPQAGSTTQGGTAAPEGIPEGSQQIGTLDGKPVYETPDGRQVVPE